jgi:hypothetical protein
MPFAGADGHDYVADVRRLDCQWPDRRRQGWVQIVLVEVLADGRRPAR